MEDEIRQALRREEPSAGFAERVLARVAAERAAPRRSWWASWFETPALRYAAAATLCATLVIGVGYEQERRTRAEGQEAKQKLMLALRITSSKLEVASERVRAVTRQE